MNPSFDFLTSLVPISHNENPKFSIFSIPPLKPLQINQEHTERFLDSSKARAARLMGTELRIWQKKRSKKKIFHLLLQTQASKQDVVVKNSFQDLVSKTSSFWTHKLSKACLERSEENQRAKLPKDNSDQVLQEIKVTENLKAENKRDKLEIRPNNSQFENSSSEIAPNDLSNTVNAIWKWGAEHDQMLLEHAFNMGFDWEKIAEAFNSKCVTPAFVEKRVKILTKIPISKSTRFSPEEDSRLEKCYKKYGINWKLIANFFPGRTPVMLKNRYYFSHRHRATFDKTHQAQKREIYAKKQEQFMENNDYQRYFADRLNRADFENAEEFDQIKLNPNDFPKVEEEDYFNGYYDFIKEEPSDDFVVKTEFFKEKLEASQENFAYQKF